MIKKEICTPSLTSVFFILSFQVLAASFGLTRPSSGHYLLKRKNAGAYNITRQYTSYSCFYKYWPDDGLVRPKLVANI
jgi:hypothetical protein